MIESFLHNAKKDGLLEDIEENEKIDLQKLLENANRDSLYLEGKTMKDILQEIYDSLLIFSEENREKYYTQLEGYRYIEKVCDLRLGIYTKCLSIENKTGKGGILVKVDVYEDKISLLCKNGCYFQRHSFNDSIIFQKLSLEEKMVLLSCEYCKKKED